MSADDLVAQLLACTDLEELAALAATVAAPVPDSDGRLHRVLESWTPAQAVANLLFVPRALPEPDRVPALLRGLRAGGYHAIAAAVGVGSLVPGALAETERRELLGALLDLVAADTGPAAVRAAAEVGPLLRAEEVGRVHDLDGHPVPAVRHNLEQAVLRATGSDDRQPVRLPHLPSYAGFLAST